MGLLFREHPKAQPGGGFLKKPGIEPATHSFDRVFFFFFFFFFFLGETSTIGGCFLWVYCSGSTRRLNRKEVF